MWWFKITIPYIGKQVVTPFTDVHVFDWGFMIVCDTPGATEESVHVNLTSGVDSWILDVNADAGEVTYRVTLKLPPVPISRYTYFVKNGVLSIKIEVAK